MALSGGFTDTENIAVLNPYKFSVYRNAAQNSSSGAFTKVNFDTKEFDTGSNSDAVTNFRFTAPIAGFYQFNWAVAVASTSDVLASLYKNGTTYKWGIELLPAGDTMSIGSAFCQAAIGDYFEIFLFCNITGAISVGTAPIKTRFEGFLVSAT